MTEESSGIQAVDSLSANEFRVEIEDEVATGIFGVSGLCVRCVALSDKRLVNQPVVITKMVQRDPELPFNRWVRETLENPTGKATRKIVVVAVDDGTETRRWVLREAWISRISFSDFDTASDVLVEERLTIQHSGVEEVWP